MIRRIRNLTYIFLSSFLISFAFSCSSEEDLDFIIREAEEEQAEDSGEEGTEEEGTEEENNDPGDDPEDNTPPPEGALSINETPCDYEVSSFTANSTYDIACTLDLGGQNFNLPDGVTLNYDGGQVINGSLNFSGNGKIDGRLLNKDLDIEGSVTLVSDVFSFYKERWGIVEGTTDDTTSRNNRDYLEQAITLTHRLEVRDFLIGAMDAFFKVDEPLAEAVPSEAAINIPSNFTLKMTDDTHLRMQPNAYIRPTLMAIVGTTNSVIDGGILHGERDEHDYSDGEVHAWGHLLNIRGSFNATVKNMTFMDAMGDGVDVNGIGHSFAANYTPANDVFILNNVFLRNRRNNLSVTDGHHIYIEGNEFIDAGIDTNNSDGVAPGFAIDVEAVRGADGTIYQVAEDIFIRNNTERGSRVGGFTVHTGDRVTFEGNQLESNISYSTSIGTIIKNNTFNATAEKWLKFGAAITAGRNDRYERNTGNKVIGNEITGYSTGIMMSNKELEVSGNEIINCGTGLVFQTLIESSVLNNTVVSNKETSNGIVVGPNSEYLNDVLIEGNSFDVQRTAIFLVGANEGPEHENKRFTVNNNTTIAGGTTISSSTGFIFTNNTLKDGLRLTGSKYGEVTGSNIETNSSHGIRIDSGNSNISITNNDISVSGNYNCIQENDTGVNMTINQNNCL